MIRMKTLPFHLLLSVWVLVSSTFASSSPLPQSTIQLPGLKEHFVEGPTNETMVLAAERTHRKDPLNHFDYYGGGWNVTDKHYIASVAFSASPLVITAILWFVLLGLFMLSTCLCCCCCRSRSLGYSKTCYTLSLIFLILFAIGAIVGCGILYKGQGNFYKSVESTFTYLVQQGRNVLYKLQGLWDSIQSAKDIQLDGHYLLAADIRQKIVEFDKKIHGSNRSYPDQISNQTIHYLSGVLDPTRTLLVIIAGVMLGFTFLGFVFSILGLRFLVYIFFIIGWILVTATFLLSAVFLIFHNVVADTCVAMDEWVQNPTAESALSQLLPCMDPEMVHQSLNMTKEVEFTTVDMINVYMANVSNYDGFPPDAFPLYRNVSGPLLPRLCNPLSPDMNPRPCAPGEIPLANASEAYKKYVCEVSSSGICISQGRLTPDAYEQLVNGIKVGYTLDLYGPFIASLVDCSFVRDTFNDIGNNFCRGLTISSRWIYGGLTTVSAAVMFSLIFWLLYVRERRERVHTKRSFVEMSRL